MADIQRRLRRKRAYNEFEETAAPTIVVPGIEFQLRQSTETVPIDEGNDIPSTALRQQMQQRIQQQQMNIPIDVSNATSCPTFLDFGAQTMRVDTETLRALVRYGYTVDIDWRRLTLPERMCIIESLLRFPQMPAFDASRFVGSLAVFNYNDPRDVMAFYIFAGEGALQELSQRTQNPRLVNDVIELLGQATKNMLLNDTPERVEHLLALAYARWHDAAYMPLYQSLVQQLAALLSDQCVADPEDLLTFLRQYETQAFAPAYAAGVDAGGGGAAAASLRQYARTRELTSQIRLECSLERVEQRRLERRITELKQLVQFSAAQAIQFILQVPYVSLYALVPSAPDADASSPSSSSYRVVQITRVEDLPSVWNSLIMTITDPSLSDNIICERTSQLLSQTLTPWMWQRYIPRGQPVVNMITTSSLSSPQIVGPAIVCNRDESVAIIQDPIHRSLREYLIALMNGQDVPQLTLVRALQHVNYLTNQWRQRHCV